MSTTDDKRLVYGMRCTWWENISAVAHTAPGPSGHRIPCCPHCGSVLFEMDSEDRFIEQARSYESNGHPGYVQMLQWARGKCFPNMQALEKAYTSEGMA